jgi:hypothetical protein
MGEDAPETVITFTIGEEGQGWSLYLTDENIAKLRKALAPFVKVAMEVSPRERKASATKSDTDPEFNKGVRVWFWGLSEEDRAIVVKDASLPESYNLAEKGRIPAGIVAAFLSK